MNPLDLTRICRLAPYKVWTEDGRRPAGIPQPSLHPMVQQLRGPRCLRPSDRRSAGGQDQELRSPYRAEVKPSPQGNPRRIRRNHQHTDQ